MEAPSLSCLHNKSKIHRTARWAAHFSGSHQSDSGIHPEQQPTRKRHPFCAKRHCKIAFKCGTSAPLSQSCGSAFHVLLLSTSSSIRFEEGTRAFSDSAARSWPPPEQLRPAVTCYVMLRPPPPRLVQSPPRRVHDGPPAVVLPLPAAELPLPQSLAAPRLTF